MKNYLAKIGVLSQLGYALLAGGIGFLTLVPSEVLSENMNSWIKAVSFFAFLFGLDLFRDGIKREILLAGGQSVPQQSDSARNIQN